MLYVVGLPLFKFAVLAYCTICLLAVFGDCVLVLIRFAFIIVLWWQVFLLHYILLGFWWFGCGCGLLNVCCMVCA